MPFYIAGKELSLEDVRLTLDKVPDRLFEHPGHGVRADQHVLRRGAVADPGLACGGRRHDLARGGAARGFLGRIRGPDRRIGALPGAELARQCQPAHGHAGL